MSTSQHYVDRDTQRCHDLLNIANLLLAQEQYRRASSVIEELRDQIPILPPFQARYFRERLAYLDREYAYGSEHALKAGGGLPENVIDLASYRRKTELRQDVVRMLAESEGYAGLVPGAKQIPVVGEDEDGNFIYRMPMPLDSVSQADSLGMEQLLNLWRGCRYAGGHSRPLPLLSDLNTEAMEELGMLGFMHVINASYDNPAHFQVQLYGSRVTLHNGRNFSGLTLADFPIPIYREAVISDYNTARMTGMPAYHRIVATIDDSRRHYTRLILPFSTDGMRPDRLLVGVRVDNWLVE